MLFVDGATAAMAGDWIKMRINLDTHPRVIELAADLKIDVLHAVGMLWKVWSWADAHSLDGNALRVTDVTLDRFVDRAGFAEALRKVGWLEGRDNALTFPRFAEHNGHTAKKRGETAVRVAKHRNTKCVTDVTQKVLPEKRREEKRREEEGETPLPPLAEGRVVSGSIMFDRKMLPLPDVLRVPTFEAAWHRWLDYLNEKGNRYTQATATLQLNDLARDGPTTAIWRIDETIKNGWLKLAEKDKPKSKPDTSEADLARKLGLNT